MLAELRIRNFAVIEEAALEFGPGLNLLSGETGAGKTIILSALGLLLGARASPEMIRADAKEAVVEGLFEFQGESELEGIPGVPFDRRELLLRRTIAEGGRSRVLIDGELGSLQTLSRVGEMLVQVYGQHEQQSLLRAESHQAILDRYAGLDSELSAYRALYQRVHELKARLDELARRERERAELLELARFRVAELERAQLVVGEDQELAKERTVLANATRLASAAAESEESLYGGEGAALDVIAQTEARLAEVAPLDPRLNEPLEMLRTARAHLQEAAHLLRAYADRIEVDPARLEQIENRLQELTRLARKYGGALEQALQMLDRSRGDIAELEKVEQSRGQAQGEFARALDELLCNGKKLSTGRLRGALELKRKMESELKTLGMRSPVFETKLGSISAADAAFCSGEFVLGPLGMDTVEFYLSPNLGQPPLPLARIASGGELSRVMLALKRLEAQRRGVSTLIFDEVDAGIGGAVAMVVGRKLKQLAKFHQILCVTHLPQIAAFADRHFYVEKEERRGSTRSRVRQLGEHERGDEIARMLGGAEVSNQFRRAAKELLERARE